MEEFAPSLYASIQLNLLNGHYSRGMTIDLATIQSLQNPKAAIMQDLEALVDAALGTLDANS